MFDRSREVRTLGDEARHLADRHFVAVGREWVDAYVRYITYVHGLYGKIQAPPAHGLSDGSEADASGSESR